MKKVDIYNAAIAVAQDQLDNANPAAFDGRISAKAVELGLDENDYQQFKGHASQVRSTIMGLKRQDDQVAAQAEAAAKNKANQSAVKPNPATGL